MKDNCKKVIWALWFFVFPIISGCFSHSTLSNVDSSPENQCIVFGKLTLIDGGEQLSWDSVYADTNQILLILPPDSSYPKGYRIKNDGYFFWALDPGEYDIISLVTPGMSVHIGTKRMLQIKFVVPEKTSSVYIGELIFSTGKKSYGYEVQRACPSAHEQFKKQFSDIKEAPINKPMDTFSIGRFSGIEHICAEAWGIDCSGEKTRYEHFYFSGIKPVSPHANTELPAQIGTKSPLFEWQASNLNDVKYDLIVYESVNWKPDLAIHLEVPGRKILYIEGLTSPRYQTEKELKPGSKYYWSVRLRRDNIVTTWSKYNFKTLYYGPHVVGMNQLFSFATPPHGPE